MGASKMINDLVDFVEALPGVEVPKDFMTQIQQKLRLAPDHEDTPDIRYRASKLGRPWVLQMVERWYGSGQRPILFGNSVAMMNGNLTQEIIAHVLSSAYNVEQEVEFTDMSIRGHADMIIKKGNNIVVLECKSMAPHMFKQFEQAPSDEYGYMSQLAFYAGCVRRDNPRCTVEAGFVIFDRGSSKFKIIPIQWFALDQRIERYKAIIPELEKVQPYDIEHLLQVVNVPPAILGKLPASMKYTKWSSYFYNVDSQMMYSNKSPEQVVERFSLLTRGRADGSELL